MTTTDPSSRTRLLDVNALLALMWDQHVHHRAARATFAGLTSFATTPVTESGFVRVLLTPAAVGRPVLPGEAFDALAALRSQPSWRWLTDDSTLVEAQVDTRVLAGRRQVTDLHLVDLAARHDAVLATFDAALPTWLAPADREHVEVWRA